MSIIKILPEIISNKIAAGEVVERPASVVKELVENAIDAYSSKIMIEIEKGGKTLIRVSDNGIGMDHDDALLALERYATSKIYNEKDLFSIKTLGFRGEAIPSIASVSRFYIETNFKGSETGTKIFVEGGKIKKVSEAGLPTGTMITVKQLFFNVPARRKFLKTDNTEFSHIADTTARIALSRPDIRFRLFHNGKIVKNWPAVSDSSVRIADVLGHSANKDFYSIDHTHNGFSVAGWISSPMITRTASSGIYVYVNGRFVKNRIVQHALFEAYSERLMKGRFPLAVLFLSVPSDCVDVNVHPSKNEVRFADPKTVHNNIVSCVQKTLNNAEKKKWEMYQIAKPEKACVSDPVASFKTDIGNRFYENGKQTDYDVGKTKNLQQKVIWSKKFFGGLRIVGQLHDTYILCESDEGLVLIDQHAAHERILYENIKKKRPSLSIAQKQIVPEIFEVNFQEKNILEKIIPDLSKSGLQIEPFGKNTFVVKAVPGYLSGKEIRPIISEIIDAMAEVELSTGLSKQTDKCLMLIACHSAIRSNQSLSKEEIKELLDQLDACENSSCCPHGRPTWVKWDLAFLEKTFKRIV